MEKTATQDTQEKEDSRASGGTPSQKEWAKKLEESWVIGTA